MALHRVRIVRAGIDNGRTGTVALNSAYPSGVTVRMDDNDEELVFQLNQLVEYHDDEHHELPTP